MYFPNATGDFTGFGNPVATATYIEFVGNYLQSNVPQQGIFAYGPYLFDTDSPNPPLQEILATGAVAPDSGGAHFASFGTLGYNEPTEEIGENDNFVFLATLDNGQMGLFSTTGIGTSVKILDTGDMLDGKTVSDIELSPDSSGDIFTTFEANFTDGSSGIFYFDTNVLPEPACMALFAAPLLLVLRRRGKTGENMAREGIPRSPRR